ncbi:hypothetical protein [Nocardia sp. GTS18]|uniref:hypothetical protein n=1 Tax=Nocardia sp. GTS18 TaxID=1778064 RepID=UPI0015EFC2C7|nr:hypothetical protein [Nocardia sp. GTS18]
MTKSIDDLLDDGAPGLQYFEQLGPRYVAAFGGSFDFYALVRPYDNERQMSITKLDAAAVAVRQLLTTADAKVSAQQSAAQSLQSGWQGAAAEAAAAQLGRIATMASEDRDAVRNFEAALTAAAAQIPGLVKAKADTVLKLMDGSVDKYVGGNQKAVPTVGGLDPIGIDSVIDGAKTGSGVLDSELTAMTSHRNSAGVTDIADTTVGIENTTSKEYKDAIKDICKRWLSIVFMPDYNDKVRIFNDQCTTTKIAIEGLFTAVETAATGVVERGYPSVAGTGSAPVQDKQTKEDQPAAGDSSKAKGDQDSGGQSGDPAGQTSAAATQTGDTSSGSTVKTATGTKDDSSTTTDDSDTALTTIASTVSSLATTVSEALTGDLGETLTSTIESVGTSIGDGIDQMTEQANSLLSQGQEATFQLGGTEVSIEAGANGLSLTTTDASGATSQYTLSLDENGQPVLTQESAPSAAEDESTGILGSGTPQSGTGQGEAGADTGSDSSAPDATGPQTPDLTDAPVTSEIGSGEESSGSVAGGVPVAPRPLQQGTDNEHVPSIDLPVSDPGDSGAVLAEAGPL